MGGGGREWVEGGGRWVTSNIVGCGGWGVSEFVPVFVDEINE